MTASTPAAKPALSFWQIWNMCFGFLGIQFGFALQNANVSRIFQTLGASMDDIPMLWIAALVLFVLWILGFVVFHVAGALIHVLIVLAVIAIIVHFVRGRR